jgi:hypothetical protein
MTAKTRQAEDPADLGDKWVEREPGAEPGDLAPDTNAEEKDEDDELEEVEVVRWRPGRHTFEERTLTKADLLRAGVPEKDARDLVWNYSNKFCLKTEDLDFLSPEQVDALIKSDPDLEVVTVEV